MHHLRVLVDITRHALRAEFLTPAGVLNLVGLFATFIVVASLGFTDAWQAIVRTWDSHYTSGTPSILWLLLIFGGIMLACVTIVGLLTRPHR